MHLLSSCDIYLWRSAMTVLKFCKLRTNETIEIYSPSTLLAKNKPRVTKKNKPPFYGKLCRRKRSYTISSQLASMVPIAPDVAMPSIPPKATAGARQAKNRKKIEDSTFVSFRFDPFQAYALIGGEGWRCLEGMYVFIPLTNERTAVLDAFSR